MAKELDYDRTIQNMFDKINRAPAFAYSIPDVQKFKEYCYKSADNLREAAKFVGVEIAVK